MAVYEPIIQAVRTWVASTLELVDPPNEVIPAAEDDDAGARPSVRPYYVVHVLDLGQRLGPSETKHVSGEVLTSVPMRGVVRLEAFGADGYDGLVSLLARVGELVDPITMVPLTSVQRIAGLSVGEIRIEARALIDFEVAYLLSTTPGQGQPFTEGTLIDLDMTLDPESMTFDLDVDLDP